MRKLVSLLLALIFALSIVSAVSETTGETIDLEAMDTAELLALAESIGKVLEIRGYTYSLTESEAVEGDAVTADTSETGDDNEITSIDEGETVLSDESFLRDMSAGLAARWGMPNEDTSLMSNRQYITYITSMVNAELAFIGKYSDYTFEDETLGKYAHAYMYALNCQLVGTEYYGKDDTQYNQYWYTDGYYVRGRYIYRINREYGLDIPSQYNDEFRELVNVGQFFDLMIPMEAALSEELRNIELSFDNTRSRSYLYTLPFNFTNTSPYNISDLSIIINFLDDNEVVVDRGYLISYENVATGRSISTNDAMTNKHFTHISYSYSFLVQTSVYSQYCEGTITPLIQYSWDGTVRQNGELAQGQPVLTITNLISDWEMNTSWNRTLYVPVLKFDVMNSGTGDADSVVVHCVFTNNETRQVWDEETVYVVSSSDSPLRVGYSKKAFVYSSVGYTRQIATVPVLTVDIYINDQLVETVTIGN